MAVSRSAALKVDWARIGTSLGLRGQTVTSLQAFKKRNEDARRRVHALSEQATEVDFGAYRAQLAGGSAQARAVVDEVEKRFRAFKPATYDVARQVRAIEAFEAEAVRNAEETREVVKAQLVDLQQTLKNIEEARPFDELTVDDVAAAEPSIDERTEQLVVKGRWQVPGYKEKFGDLAVI
jgi:F-type H+-transporting ATPase subunit d